MYVNFISSEDKPLGRELEDGLRFVFKKYYRNDFVLPTKEQDEKEGTDCFVRGLRVDFTADMAAKDHCEVSNQTEFDLGDDVKVQYGVRTGNSYCGGTQFDEPVLVIGVTGDQRFVYTNMLELLDRVKAHVDEILALGEDVYWAHEDGQPI